MQSSLYFRVFVLRELANLRGHLNGQEHQNFLTTRRVPRAIRKEVHGDESKKKQLPYQRFRKEKKGTNNTNMFLFGGCKLFADFRFSWRVLENEPNEKWKDRCTRISVTLEASVFGPKRCTYTLPRVLTLKTD